MTPDTNGSEQWDWPTPTPRTVKRTVAFLGAVLVLAVVMAFAVGGEG